MADERQLIICGTDFSEHSKQAADVAAALAVRTGVPLLLVHVGEQCDPDSEYESEQAQLVADLETQLRAEALRLEGSGARVEEVMVCAGLAENVLVDLIKERQAKLAVVSSVSKTRSIIGRSAASPSRSRSAHRTDAGRARVGGVARLVTRRTHVARFRGRRFLRHV
jgi:nucleotide-binding universal stress UspA family protein